MATLQEIYNVRFEAVALRQRVIGAIMKAASDILNDADATNQYKKWAARMLRDPMHQSEAFLIQCALNPTIAAAGDSATDNDIQFVVNGVVGEMVSELNNSGG